MDASTIIQLYLIVGLSYTLINGLIRKLDTDDDYMLPFVWTFLWWICFIALFIQWIGKKMNKF